MTEKGKTRKPYTKPEIRRVILEMEEMVLQTCKSSQGDPAGKVFKYCGHPVCKKSYGS